MEGFQKTRVFIIGGILFLVFLLLPKSSLAATLFLSPSSATYNTGSKINISVKVNAEDQSINAVDGTIGFNPGNLEVVSVSKSNSILNLWIQDPTYSNSAGNINFGGVILNPGYSGSNGNLITVTLKAKKDGQANVNFITASVLANDGHGTNVLKSMNGASFNIGQAQSVPKIEPPTPESTGLEIVSPTHPDQDKWYSNSSPSFNWELLDAVTEVRLVLSKRAGTLPQISYIPPISEKSLTDVGDGIWFLNVRFRTSQGLGSIASFQFKIDTKQPRDFTISRLDEDDPTNPQPMLIFESSDDLSGLDRYEMKIGDGDWFKIAAENGGKPYQLPFQTPGAREISVKAFDRAGNSTTTTTTTTTTTIETPIIEQTIPPKVKPDFHLIIAGLAKPEQKVLVFIQYLSKYSALISSSAAIKLETIADSVGRWSIEYEKPLPKGKHQIYAQSVDERGAISDPSNYVALEVISGSIFDRALELLFRGFDSLVNFLSEGWFLIAAGVVVASMVILIIRKVVPFIAEEIKRFAYISREYKLNKLKKRSKKMQFEIKTLQDDVQKELNLLKKIEQHRDLHPDEKYIKEKMWKYLNLIKRLR